MFAYESWQNGLTVHHQIMHDRFVESPFVHPSIVMRKDVLVHVGGYRDYGWPEDYDLWLRMADAGVRFGRLPEILFFWRDHPERATRTMPEYSATAFRTCKFHHLQQDFLKDVQAVIIVGAGLEGRAWQRLLTSAGIRVSGWIDVDPRKIGKSLLGAPVVGPEVAHLHKYKLIVAIGVRGAREQFRTLIKPAGLQEGLDFICVS
jgi:hypothetical protein